MKRPASLRRISSKGLDLIATFEGLRLTAYKPTPGEPFWTIGYGHYGPDVKPGQRISKRKARSLLRGDVREAEKAVRRACKAARYKVTQGEYDALVSIVFNCGPGILDRGRSLGDAIRRHSGIARAMRLYVNGADGRLEGLVRRREAEVRRFRA